MEDYISKSLPDRELISRVYKEHLLNKNQICFKKWAKNLDISPKKIHTWPVST